MIHPPVGCIIGRLVIQILEPEASDEKCTKLALPIQSLLALLACRLQTEPLVLIDDGQRVVDSKDGQAQGAGTQGRVVDGMGKALRQHHGTKVHCDPQRVARGHGAIVHRHHEGPELSAEGSGSGGGQGFNVHTGNGGSPHTVLLVRRRIHVSRGQKSS